MIGGVVVGEEERVEVREVEGRGKGGVILWVGEEFGMGMG